MTTLLRHACVIVTAAALAAAVACGDSSTEQDQTVPPPSADPTIGAASPAPAGTPAVRAGMETAECDYARRLNGGLARFRAAAQASPAAGLGDRAVIDARLRRLDEEVRAITGELRGLRLDGELAGANTLFIEALSGYRDQIVAMQTAVQADDLPRAREMLVQSERQLVDRFAEVDRRYPALSRSLEQCPSSAASPTPSSGAATRPSPPSVTAGTARPGSPSPARSPTATAASRSPSPAPRILEARWYQDGDGNAIPDFLETELGADPRVDDCPSKQCGAGGAGADRLVDDRNVLLILDSSGSMAESGGGRLTKMEVAKTSLARYASVTALRYNLGFMVYGHRGDSTESGRAASCAGIELLMPIGKVEPDAIRASLDRFQPTGWTPVAGAIRQATAAFRGREGQVNRVYLVSDGIETCDGDPVEAARELKQAGGPAVEVTVVGFGVDRAAAEQLRRVADVTGGTYVDARSGADLEAYFRAQAEEVSKACDAAVCELGNSFHAALCDSTLVTRATLRIGEIERRTTNQSEREAYAELQRRIRSRLEDRNRAREEAEKRREQSADLCARLREQFRTAFAATIFGP